MRAVILMLLAVSLEPWQGRMLDLHNQLRARRRLPPLHWSPDLSEKAGRWAKTLLATGQIRHDPSRHGQNIFAITRGNATADFVFQAWASEEDSYDYHHNSCSGMCGHYTQIVWRNTHEVGCAVARNAHTSIWVCDYSPAGNVNRARPY